MKTKGDRVVRRRTRASDQDRDAMFCGPRIRRDFTTVDRRRDGCDEVCDLASFFEQRAVADGGIVVDLGALERDITSGAVGGDGGESAF